MSLFCPSMVNINLPCSDSQRPEHDKIPAMCLTCLWFDIVISFFSPIKSKSVSNPFFPNSFFSKQGMKTFPFPPQSPYWEGSGVKTGVQLLRKGGQGCSRLHFYQNYVIRSKPRVKISSLILFADKG